MAAWASVSLTPTLFRANCILVECLLKNNVCGPFSSSESSVTPRDPFGYFICHFTLNFKTAFLEVGYLQSQTVPVIPK